MVILPFLLAFVARTCAPVPASPIEIPFELVSNKPFLQVRIGDSPPLSFILDSGAAGGSVLDLDTARKLHLRVHDLRRAHLGAGDGVQTRIGRLDALTVSLAGRRLTLPHPSAIAFDHVAPYEGRPIHGLLGEDIFRRFIVDIDYPARVVRLHDRSEFHYAGRGILISLQPMGGFAAITADLRLPDGQVLTGDYILDTGLRASVVLAAPYVRKHDLTHQFDRAPVATIGGGLGGESRGRLVRAASLRLGPLTFDEPVMILSTDRTGVLAGRSLAGIIGGQLLHHYRVIFDYTGRQLILDPANRTVNLDYDRSGMFLVARPPDYAAFEIMSVANGSAAAAAGLQRGDLITRINGEPAARWTLDELRRLLRQSGPTHHLDVSRNNNTRTIPLTPRPYI